MLNRVMTKTYITYIDIEGEVSNDVLYGVQWLRLIRCWCVLVDLV